jgi:hypothetical protein
MPLGQPELVDMKLARVAPRRAEIARLIVSEDSYKPRLVEQVPLYDKQP